MLTPPQADSPLVNDWLERHPGQFNRLIHFLAIPISILGFLIVPMGLAALSWHVLALGLAVFVLGYLLQFLGHALERTMPGELRLVMDAWKSRRKAGRVQVPA
jgi:uncharacterized membrane protein YGL010W